MNPRIPNLPSLRPRHNVKIPETSGMWTSIDVNLETVAAALPVDRKKAFIDTEEPVRAIPDPWAQATAFGHALLKASRNNARNEGGEDEDDELDGLTRRALSQWRGLLAVLAVHHLHSKDFTLRPQGVDLSDGRPFANVLTTLTPEVAIEGTAALWRQPRLIMLQQAGDVAGLFESPLAMTNPICLVSPGRSSHQLVVPNLQWAQGDLHDPLRPGSPKLSRRDLSILYHYIADLTRGVGQRSGEVASDIARLLTSYARDIQTALNGAPDRVLPPETQHSGNEPELFKPLWNQYKIDESVPPPGGRKSEAILKAGPAIAVAAGTRPGAFKGFVLVDPAVAEAYGKDPTDVLIWGRTDLASLLKSEAKLSEVRNAAAIEGYILLTVDDLLTGRAARLKKRPLIASHPDGLQEMILPVRPLALLLASDLKSAVSGSTAGDRAMVTLKLRLDDGTNEGRSLQLTRHFALNPSSADEHLLVEAEDWEIYNCQVWPNFRSSAWKTYLARFLYNEGQANKITRPSQALSAALLREEIARAGDCTNAAQAIKRVNAGQKISVSGGDKEAPLFNSLERLTGRNNSFREETQFSNQAFDAIYYVDALGDERSEAPVGMVLLDLLPFTDKPAGKATKVAIDFGTTNTVVAIDSMEAHPLVFANRLVLPIRYADAMVHDIAVHGMRLQFTDFLPPEERSTPIPTVAIPKLPYNSAEKLWAFRNLIFFYTAQPPAEGGEEAELNAFLVSTESALFDLKWSRDPHERNAAEDFLTQFIVMAAAELLAKGTDPAKSTWYFSVPEALEKEARDQLHAQIKNSSRAIGQSASTAYPPLLSEGLAAGRYMLNTKKFVANKLNIVLDIGGGTTDITIWKSKQPVWRGSVKLAGRNFFTSLLVQNSYILESIGLAGWARSLNAFGTHHDPEYSEKRRKQMAEMLFSGRSTSGEEPDLQRAMKDFWSRITSTDGDPLRHAALVYFAGVAWYVGKVVRQLMRAGNLGAYDNKKPGGEVLRLVSDPAFAVCGRGGGIFQMMHGMDSKADAETTVTKALSIFGRSVGIDDCEHPRFSSSDAPKLEVVRGMLSIKNVDQAQEIQASAITGLSNVMPAGLLVETDKGKIGPDAEFKSASLSAEIQAVDMGEFIKFLEAFEACTGVVVDIRSDEREGAHQRIAAEVVERMNEMREELDKVARNQKGRVGIEPPFLIALRSLVDIMALSEDDRKDLLRVWGAE